MRFITCLCVSLGLAFGLASAAAPDSSGASLQKRVAALEKKNKALTKKVNNLALTLSCLTYQPVPLTAYGSGDGSFGYYFDNDGAGSGTAFYTSGLDFTGTGDTVHAWVAGVDPACISARRAVAARSAHSGSIFSRQAFRAPTAGLLRHQ